MKILYQPDQYAQQRQREKKRWIWPVHLAMEATKMRDEGNHVYWDKPEFKYVADKIITEPQGLPFLSLPAPDRKLTDAFNPKFQNNGNYKYHPGTYIQSAIGCWHGACTFCKEKEKKYEVRNMADIISEIAACYNMGFREIFDDSASFPVGKWLDEFCKCYTNSPYTGSGNIKFSCNMRFGANPDYKKMKDAGFRMLLYGLESGNQETLNRINKGTHADQMVGELMLASKYGLEPHIAYMVSYPWETLEEEMNTVKLVQWLLKKGYAKTAQCSVYTPPDGKAWEERIYLTQKLYNVAFMPEFWYNRFKDLRSIDDLKYLLRGIKEGLMGTWVKK